MRDLLYGICYCLNKIKQENGYYNSTTSSKDSKMSDYLEMNDIIINSDNINFVDDSRESPHINFKGNIKHFYF